MFSNPTKSIFLAYLKMTTHTSPSIHSLPRLFSTVVGTWPSLPCTRCLLLCIRGSLTPSYAKFWPHPASSHHGVPYMSSVPRQHTSTSRIPSFSSQLLQRKVKVAGLVGFKHVAIPCNVGLICWMEYSSLTGNGKESAGSTEG